MKKVEISINGKKIEVPSNYTILEAARANGFKIPTLCYDERLKPSGACRMCVVEVEGARSLVTACSTPIRDGMVIKTNSDRVVNSRKTTLELLWADHDYDCLRCEKSGDCELQDLCYEYDIEPEARPYIQSLTNNIDESNKFYSFNEDKCILCGKCVRVCEELVGVGAISFTQRGHYTHISHPFETGMDLSDCVSCGTCVSVCPTGALMEKTKTKFRVWDVEKKVKTTCTYCGVGCQLELVVKDDKVVRVDAPKDSINNGITCVKGKFGYKFIDSGDRLTMPLIRKKGELVESSWEEAYDLIVSKMNGTLENYGPDSFAALSSARCTNEDNYLLQKLFRGVIKTNSVDHCARL